MNKVKKQYKLFGIIADKDPIKQNIKDHVSTVVKYTTVSQNDQDKLIDSANDCTSAVIKYYSTLSNEIVRKVIKKNMLIEKDDFFISEIL